MKAILVFFLLITTSVSYASGIYRCVDATGKQSFSSKPCSNDQDLVEHRMSESQRRQIREQEEAEARSLARSQELSLWSRAENSAPVSNSGWDSSVRQVRDYLKNVLNDPDSLDTINWFPVFTKQGEQYRVRYQYRAKNAFGGYVVADQVFILNRNGQVTRVVDFNGDHVVFH